LTSAISERRRRLLPVTRKWDVPAVADAIKAHARARNTRVTVAWVVIAGENTGLDEVEALRALFGDAPGLIKLNIIDVNDGDGHFQPADATELGRFRDHLRTLGVPVVRRYSGGKDKHAACGMLAAKALDGVASAPPPISALNSN
jgi:23S rRNA (adenine2503-C2)-methyltransferase